MNSRTARLQLVVVAAAFVAGLVFCLSNRTLLGYACLLLAGLLFVVFLTILPYIDDRYKAMSNLVSRIVDTKWVIVLPFALYLILAIGIVYTNRPWSDEAWFASPAVNLVRNGSMGTTIFPLDSMGRWEGIQQHTFWQPPLWFLMEALTFKLFGVGLFQLRLISVFWGLVGLIAVYYLARELFNNDRKLLLLSLVLVGTDHYYSLSAGDGRMDMMAVSLSLVAFALYLNLRKKNLSWAIFSSNLFVCLSGLTHPNGLLGLLVLVFLILYLDRKRIGVGVMVIGIVPYALGAVGWGVYIMRDVEAFKAQFFANAIREDTLTWKAIPHELLNRYLDNYSMSLSRIPENPEALIPMIFFLGLIAVPFVTRRRLLWGMLVIVFLGMMFLVGHKCWMYLVWLTPLFLLNTVLVWDAVRQIRPANVFFSLAFCCVVVASLGWTVRMIGLDDYHRYYLSDLRQFNSRYYTGGMIYGSGEMAFFYDFDDNLIQDDGSIGFSSGVKPRYFVTDRGSYKMQFDYARSHNPEKWEYIDETLSNEYSKVFQGNFLTFFERKTQ